MTWYFVMMLMIVGINPFMIAPIFKRPKQKEYNQDKQKNGNSYFYCRSGQPCC